jgi:hypothetical protein
MQKSLTAKMPFKALVCREALTRRTAELGRSTFESFENSKLASAILLTRVAVETSAALWYLCWDRGRHRRLPDETDDGQQNR